MRKFILPTALAAALGLSLIPAPAQASWLSEAIHRLQGDYGPVYYAPSYPTYVAPTYVAPYEYVAPTYPVSPNYYYGGVQVYTPGVYHQSGYHHWHDGHHDYYHHGYHSHGHHHR